jgi:hypothetical protein
VTSPTGGTCASPGRRSTARPRPASPCSGAQFDITAPDATAAKPLELRFRLHTSLLPAGQDLSTLLVLRNGAAAGECAGSVTAVPDPCVSKREQVGDELVLTVLTSKGERLELRRADRCGRLVPGRSSGPGVHRPGGQRAPRRDRLRHRRGHRPGLTPTTYGVDREVTRGQMAAFIARTVRAAGGTLPTGAPDAFATTRATCSRPTSTPWPPPASSAGKAPGRFDPAAVVPARPDGDLPGPGARARHRRAAARRTGRLRRRRAAPPTRPASTRPPRRPDRRRRPPGPTPPSGTVRRDQMASFLHPPARLAAVTPA